MTKYISIKGMFADSSTPVKFLIAFFTIIFCSFFFAAIGIIGIKLITDQTIALKIYQLLSSIGTFIISPILICYLISYNTKEYLSICKTKGYFFLMALICITVAIPFINFTTILNEQMELSDCFKQLEEIMKGLEDKQGETTKLFLNVNSIPGYLLNLLILALIPAIGEELLFRGFLQKAIFLHTKNIHIAIWCAGILFSAIHLQFYGFFPRLFMGVLFGYFLVWSGSILVPMACHFINNALIVTYSYIMPESEENILETFGSKDIILCCVSFFLIILICTFMNKTKVVTSDSAKE